MIAQKILPYTMVVLSVGASIGYLLVKDYRRAIYWAAAATITMSVTWGCDGRMWR